MENLILTPQVTLKKKKKKKKKRKKNWQGYFCKRTRQGPCGLGKKDVFVVTTMINTLEKSDTLAALQLHNKDIKGSVEHFVNWLYNYYHYVYYPCLDQKGYFNYLSELS